MNPLDFVIRLLGFAASVEPVVERLLRAGVAADPTNPIAGRVAAVLPAVGESEQAEADLRSER